MNHDTEDFWQQVNLEERHRASEEESRTLKEWVKEFSLRGRQIVKQTRKSWEQWGAK